MKFIDILLFILIIGLIASIFFTINLKKQNSLLNAKLISTNNNFNQYKEITNKTIENLNQTLYDYNKTNYDMYNNLIDLNKQYFDLLTKYNNTVSQANSISNYNDYLKEEIDNTFKEIKTYKEDLQTAVNWFKNNAILNNSVYHFSFVKTYLNKCINDSGQGCKINLGCINFVNNKKLNIDYKTNYDNKKDQIIDLNNFIKNKGGDCEDFSLFYKAEINYLKSKCKNNNIYFIAGENKTGSKFFVYDNWYLTDTISKTYNYTYPTIICGDLYDPNKKKIGGHCLLALTKNKLLDINGLNDAIVFEPQNGLVLGDFKKTTSLLPNKLNNSFIEYIITDNDFYSYSENKNAWVGNNYFISVLNNKEKKLKDSLKNPVKSN